MLEQAGGRWRLYDSSKMLSVHRNSPPTGHTMNFIYGAAGVIAVWILFAEAFYDSAGPRDDAYLGSGVFVFLTCLFGGMAWIFFTNLPP